MPFPFCQDKFLPPANPDDVCAVMRRMVQLHEFVKLQTGYMVDCDKGNLPANAFALEMGAIIVPTGTVWQYFPSTNNYDLVKSEVENVWGAPNAVGLPWWEVVIDMEGRFVLGASKADYAPNSIAGDKTVTLTVEQMPAHNHNEEDNDRLLQATGYGTTEGTNSSPNTDEPDLRTSGTIKSAGGGQSHNNMPPYRAIVWMRRTSRMQV